MEVFAGLLAFVVSTCVVADKSLDLYTGFDGPGGVGGLGGAGGEEDLLENIPGNPGQDYPIYSEVPETAFICDGQVDGGYYSDPEAECQAFHICVSEGLGLTKFSFLCPNGTLFNQQYFICDWWFNVDCSQAESLYFLNDEIAAEREAISGDAGQGDYGGGTGQGGYKAAASALNNSYNLPKGSKKGGGGRKYSGGSGGFTQGGRNGFGGAGANSGGYNAGGRKGSGSKKPQKKFSKKGSSSSGPLDFSPLDYSQVSSQSYNSPTSVDSSYGSPSGAEQGYGASDNYVDYDYGSSSDSGYKSPSSAEEYVSDSYTAASSYNTPSLDDLPGEYETAAGYGGRQGKSVRGRGVGRRGKSLRRGKLQRRSKAKKRGRGGKKARSKAGRKGRAGNRRGLFGLRG